MKESDIITKGVIKYCRDKNHEVTVANFFYKDYEFDIFSMTSSGYIYEFEVKISKSDFKRDFTHKADKHKQYANNKNITNPNRFFYVCPEGLIKKEELPPYAGLIYTRIYPNDKVYLDLIVDAPLIHKSKQGEKIYKWLTGKLYWRHINMVIKYGKLKMEMKMLKKKHKIN